MNRRRALQLLAALGTTGLVAGCGSDTDEGTAQPGSPVKIGLIVPSAGPNKAVGEDLTRGFQLFLSLNDQQLGGHPTTLITAEEGDDAKSGQAAVDRLIKEGALALTGVVSPTVLAGIRDTVEQARVPLVSSNGSPISLASVVYIWRTAYVLDEPGEAIGQYLRQTLKDVSSRIAIIAPDSPSSRDVIDGFRRGYEGGGRVLNQPIFTPDDPNAGRSAYADAITQVLDADAIFCNYTGTAAVQFIKELYDEGYRKKLYAPGFLTEGIVLGELDDQEGGKQRARILDYGIETALNYSPDLNNTANRVFASAYRKTYNASPTTYAMASYDAAQVLDKAIRLVGASPTPQQVNLALGKIGQVDSPRGAWQFNQPRTPQQKWYLRRVQLDGQMLANVVINELTTLG